MAPSTPKVFISYSHDSPEHRQRVLALSERLRTDGIDAQLDQYVAGTPKAGWPRWMLNQLDWANFVLLVCTETYYKRFRGHEAPDKGKGVDWEGNLITSEIYSAKSKATKFAPVLFDGQTSDSSQSRFVVILATCWIRRTTTISSTVFLSNASLEEQAAFFVQILENRRDVLADMPNVVCVSVHSAFDMSWKTGWPYFEWDPYTGLLDSNGAPRPAAKMAVERLP
jgi:hypothetical protein